MQTENTLFLNSGRDVFWAKPPTVSKVLLIIYFKNFQKRTIEEPLTTPSRSQVKEW